MNTLKTIDEYLINYPDIYYSCKALNYRTFMKKYDGNRPLSVFVDWFVTDGKLDYNIVFDSPLVTKGDEVYNHLALALERINVASTDDLNASNVINAEIIYE